MQPQFSMSRAQSRPVNYARGFPFSILCRPTEATRDLVEEAALELVTIIQREAANSGLRMFLFNQMSDNGFNNRDFFDLVQTTLDLIDAEIMTYRRVPVGLVQDCAKLATDWENVLNADRFNLFEFISRDLHQDVVNGINMAKEERRVRLRTPARGAERDPYHDATRSRYTPTYDDRRGYDDRGGLPRSYQSVARAPVYAPTTVSAAPPRVSVAGNPREQVPPVHTPDPAYEQRMRTPTARLEVIRAGAAIPRQQPVVADLPSCTNLQLSEKDKAMRRELALAVSKNGTVVVDVQRYDDPGVQFVATDKWWFIPVFNAKTHTLYYIIKDDGAMCPITVKAFEEFDVDAEKHLGKPANYVQAVIPQPAKVKQQQKLLDSITESLDAQEALFTDIVVIEANEYAAAGVPAEEIPMKDRVYSVCDLSQGWLIADHTAGVMKEQLDKPSTISAVRVKVSLTDTVIDSADSAWLDHLGNMKDFSQLRTAITTQLDKLQCGIPTTLVSEKVISRIDKRLANEISHVLKNVIGVDITIDSFLDPNGGGALMAYLSENMPSIGSLLLDYQEEIISAALSRVHGSDEISEILYSLCCETPTDQKPPVVMFTSSYVLVKIGFESTVFFNGMVMPHEVCHINANEMPVLNKLFATLRKDMKTRERLIIQLEDGVTVHVNRGVLEDSPFAMRVEKAA